MRSSGPTYRSRANADVLGFAIATALLAHGCSTKKSDDGSGLPPDGFAGESAGAGAAGIAGTLAVAGGGGQSGAGNATGFAGSGGGIAGGTAGSSGIGGRNGAGGAGNGGSSGVGGAAGAGAGGRGGAGAGAGAGGSAGSAGAGPITGDVTLHFGPNVRINDDMGRTPQNEVMLAAGGGVVVAGWNDGRDATGRTGYHCGFSVSRDGGMTWSRNIFAVTKGTASGSFDGDPGVAVDEAGNLYLSCEDYGVQQIVFASSTDKGMTFSPFRNVQSAIDKPWIAAARDGTVFLTWLGRPGGYKRSLDHGQTWETVISLGNLSRGTGISSGSMGLVHVPFATDNGQMRYVRSKDWGQTLETPRDLGGIGTQSCTSNCEPRSLPITSVASDPTGQIVAITWAGILSGGDGDDDVWALVSMDGGTTWSRRIRVADNKTASRQFQPWAAVDSTGRVHIAWTDLRTPGMNAVYYANMTDPAKGFGPSVEVTDERGDSNIFLGDYKAIVVSDGFVYVAWTDTRGGDSNIYIARAALSGALPM